MCHKVTCDVCGKPTWEGCGDHIEHALEGVAVDDRCHCKAFQGTDTPSNAFGTSSKGAGVSSW
ncbi:MAG: hypothetical protein ABIS84_08230 [Arachnia sp.]